jgi:DNA-binding LytR/AlgR family response regulator
MTTKTKQQFISDKFHYGSDDLVEVNALDFIQLLTDQERLERTVKMLNNTVSNLEVALECARIKRDTINLRG